MTSKLKGANKLSVAFPLTPLFLTLYLSGSIVSIRKYEEIRMRKSVRVLLIVASIIAILPLQSCVVNRPVKPGSDFVWVVPHSTPGGVLIPGHWKYIGPPRHGRVWVPGHYNRRGDWISGRWKRIGSPRKGSYWVQGHRTSSGRWIPGHWRCR